MSQDLLGKWYVYRYNVSRHVLKAPETELEIKPSEASEGPQDDCSARFQLSGWDDPVEVQMVFDAGTDSWFGESGSLDFRWERVLNSATVMLIGHASDRGNLAYRDFFMAVQSRRTRELPWPPPKKIYQFGPSYENFLERNRRVLLGSGVCIDPDANEITFNGTKYQMQEAFGYELGMRIIGLYEDVGLERRLSLWLLPLDETERLLATGYLYEIHDLKHPSAAGDPMCTKGSHGG